LLLFYSGINKLVGGVEVARAYAKVGVPADKLPYLAALLHAGGAGLIAGFWWAPIGIAAAAGVTAYFLCAIAAHVRFGELRTLPVPLMIVALAAVTLALRVATRHSAL
jgi:hypothetical protein